MAARGEGAAMLAFVADGHLGGDPSQTDPRGSRHDAFSLAVLQRRPWTRDTDRWRW